MNGNRGDRTNHHAPMDWEPARFELSEGYKKASKRGKLIREAIAFGIFVLVMILFFAALSMTPAEARQRFVQRQASPCANGQCVKQQVVVQKVVAQPVVHHQAVVAQPIYAAPVAAYAAPTVQNNWYAVGQPLVQQAALANAVRDVLAEQTFKATVNATIQGSVSGAAQQQFYQPAPQQQPWQPPAEPLPPAEPDAPPTFSQTGHGALQEHCAGCHANGAAKGGFSLDSMTGDQLWAAIDRIKEGSMPPQNPLADYAKEAVAKELLTRQP